MSITRLAISILFGVLTFGASTNGDLPLVVTTELAKPEVVLGEPACVTIKILNTTDQPRRLAIQAWGVAKVLISSDGKVFRQYSPGAVLMEEGYARWGSSGSRLPLVLAAQRTHRQHLFIVQTAASVKDQSGQAEWLGLPGAGEYLIKACVGDLCSNLVKLKVTPPQGVDAQVWDQLRAAQFTRLVQASSLSLNRSELDAIEEILKEIPNSVYTPYVAYSLAKHYQTQVWSSDQPVGSVEVAAQTQKARRFFEVAAKTTTIPAIREEAMLQWAALSGGADGVAIARQALLEFPDGTHRDRFERLIEKHTRPKWVDPMDIVGKELEAMGYDPEMADVSEAKIAEMTEYVHREPQRLHQEGKLTDEQMRTEQARRLKEWTLKNLKPTLPPKTNDTSTILAPAPAP